MKIHDYTGETCGNYKVIKKIPKKDKKERGRTKYVCQHVVTGKEVIYDSRYLYKALKRKILQNQRKLEREQDKKDKIK